MSNWLGAPSIVSLARDTRCTELMLLTIIELARTEQHRPSLAEADTIELCGQLAMNPETAPEIQLLALQGLSELAQSTEHRTRVDI